MNPNEPYSSGDEKPVNRPVREVLEEKLAAPRIDIGSGLTITGRRRGQGRGRGRGRGRGQHQAIARDLPDDEEEAQASSQDGYIGHDEVVHPTASLDREQGEADPSSSRPGPATAPDVAAKSRSRSSKTTKKKKATSLGAQTQNDTLHRFRDTRENREHLLRCFRDTINHPITERSALNLLRRNDMSLERAVSDWRDNLNYNQGRSRSRLDSPPLRRTVTRSRASLIWTLHRRLQRRGIVKCGSTIHAVDVAVTLRYHDWDIDQAEIAYIETDGVCISLTSDRRLRSARPTQKHMDERFAEFLGLTDHADIDLARGVLEQNDWDLCAAVNEWLNRDMVATNAPDEKSPLRSRAKATATDGPFPKIRVARENNETLVSENGLSSLWEDDWKSIADSLPDVPHPDDGKGSESDYESESEAEPEFEPGKKQQPKKTKLKRTGFIINADDKNARYCYPQPAKFLLERITKGGHYKPLAWERAHTGIKTNGVVEPFSWNRSDHVSKLNSWRRQEVRRTTGETVKRPAVPFNQAEDNWLYDRYKEEFDRNGRFGQRVKLNMKQIVADFNTSFQGTHQPGSANERPERTTGSLTTHLQRVEKICTDFGLPLQHAHGPPKGRKPGGQKAATTVKEATDSEQFDTSEQDASEAEEEVGRKRTRSESDEKGTAAEPPSKRGKKRPK